MCVHSHTLLSLVYVPAIMKLSVYINNAKNLYSFISLKFWILLKPPMVTSLAIGQRWWALVPPPPPIPHQYSICAPAMYLYLFTVSIVDLLIEVADTSRNISNISKLNCYWASRERESIIDEINCTAIWCVRYCQLSCSNHSVIVTVRSNNDQLVVAWAHTWIRYLSTSTCELGLPNTQFGKYTSLLILTLNTFIPTLRFRIQTTNYISGGANYLELSSNRTALDNWTIVYKTN